MFSLFGLEINLSIIAAVLTIVGYSMNDTVVIFDRVRENLRKYSDIKIYDLTNISINETLSRTLITSITTLLALLSIFFFGGEILKGFSLAMIFGVVFGTYSSIGFTFGIDSLMNVSDTLQTVEESAMAWGMGSGGYHYMKLEGTYDSLGVDSITKSYALHTGPSMGKSYDFHITFKNSAFTINEEGLSLEITMDVNEWFTGSSNDENYDFCNYGQMIMMNTEAQKKLKENGNSVFSIDVK